MHQQLDSGFGGDAVAELVHLTELPRGVDVQQRERQRRWEERLLREAKHDRTVLAERVEHHRPLRLGDGLAEDVDALGLESLEMSQPRHLGLLRWTGRAGHTVGQPARRRATVPQAGA
mgnify:CR=1 FL=1